MLIWLSVMPFMAFAESLSDSIYVNWLQPEKEIKGRMYRISALGVDGAVALSIGYKNYTPMQIRVQKGESGFPMQFKQEIGREQSCFSFRTEVFQLLAEDKGDRLLVISSIYEEEGLRTSKISLLVAMTLGVILGIIFILRRCLRKISP